MPQPMQRVSFLTPAWRWLATTLLAVSAVNLPFSLVAALVMTDPPVTPGMLLRSLVVFSLLPAAAAWAALRLLRGSVEVSSGVLRCERPGLRMEIPASDLESIAPWVVPLPGAGFDLRLAQGRTAPCGLLSSRPDALLDVLAGLAPAAAESARRHATVVYARNRRPAGVARLLLKFPVFGALPTAILFNLHQNIAYGGTLGQYHLQGIVPFLVTLAVYWTTVTLYLILYASVWRGVAEAASLASAWLAPARAAKVRSAAEVGCAVAYYGGAPIILLARLLA